MPFERINIPKQPEERAPDLQEEPSLGADQVVEEAQVYHESDALPPLESVLNPPKPYVGKRVREVEAPIPAEADQDLAAVSEEAESLIQGSEHSDSGEEWKHNLGLPPEDNLQRDWSRYNRKLAFMYPQVVLPAWKRKR